MSTANIQAQYPTPEGYVVVFATRSGPRAYMYTLAEGALIAAGHDPKNFNGTETEIGITTETVEGAADLVEGLAAL